jgi:amidase
MDHISRRGFLSASAAGGAALLTGGIASLVGTSSAAGSPSSDLWIEKSIPELQALMASGALTSRDLTQGYLQRIQDLNPLLHAVIETNPQAVAIAAKLDNERRAGHVRGPLHGIPILVKDNIATNDRMETTAGSLALVGSRVPGDAPLVARLRAAGAVILGKANLAEWANFRGFAPWDFNGWTPRGGKTRDPYLLSFDPCGSSSGSAVAAAANLCTAAIGTETDGSIVCPASNNHIFGLKPTLGLIAQAGIIPIAHSQDTAGPMARTVIDLAILLNVTRSPFGPVLGHQIPSDYTQFLDANSLEGKTIGIDQRYLTGPYAFPVNPNTLEAFNTGLDALESLVRPSCLVTPATSFSTAGTSSRCCFRNSRWTSNSTSPG